MRTENKVDTATIIYAALIVFFFLGIFVVMGCSTTKQADEIQNQNNTGFEYVEKLDNRVCLFYDKETKVEYVTTNSVNAGFCVRVDADGNPMLYDETQEELHTDDQ